MTETVSYASLEKRPLSAWDVIAHLCAIGVAGFFLYAAYHKIGVGGVRQFALEIKNYQMAFLDERYLNIPAIILPWIEVMAALALIVPASRKGGAVVIGGLLVIFIIAVFDAAIVRGLDIGCGCTGKSSGKAGWTTIGRNAGLLAATVASVYLPRLG
ncbi:MAG TPA: MauE/DoxX family redox-associated membrane protein, partial [Phycisphaerae bacterium]|nr:MauE/DoxX family redox-associated membrane protein [Phycisphaerae bacterium]